MVFDSLLNHVKINRKRSEGPLKAKTNLVWPIKQPHVYLHVQNTFWVADGVYTFIKTEHSRHARFHETFHERFQPQRRWVASGVYLLRVGRMVNNCAVYYQTPQGTLSATILFKQIKDDPVRLRLRNHLGPIPIVDRIRVKWL